VFRSQPIANGLKLLVKNTGSLQVCQPYLLLLLASFTTLTPASSPPWHAPTHSSRHTPTHAAHAPHGCRVIEHMSQIAVTDARRDMLAPEQDEVQLMYVQSSVPAMLQLDAAVRCMLMLASVCKLA